MSVPTEYWDISIHAPAKGATLNNSSILSTNFYFNPRSREGSDVDVSVTVIVLSPFQSTLPRRERLIKQLNPFMSFAFQSTLPRRERLYKSIIPTSVISAFQSTLPRRERLNNSSILSTNFYFNPRSREGSDSNEIILGF